MYKTQRNLFYLILIIISILFSACSSSSNDGDSGKSGDDINLPQDPIAVDDTVLILMDTSIDIEVLLNDRDPNGDALIVNTVTLPTLGGVVINANGTITYTPTPGMIGTDEFDYTISDSDGNHATAHVTITIKATNTAPIANAGTPQTVHLNTSVTLNGSASTDADGDSLYYSWSVVNLPNGSNLTTIENNTSMVASFTPDVIGSYTFSLNVTDGIAQDNNTTEILVTNNNLPTAVISKVINVAAFNTAVQLDASNSSDPEGDTLTYRWTQLSGTDVTGGVGYLTGVSPLFNTPQVEGLLDFNLTVSDGTDTSEPVTGHVSVLEYADNAIFVSASGDDNDNGSYEAPIHTVAAAFASGINHIYVQQGSYLESVTLADNTMLLGSYDSFWSKTPMVSSTIVGTSNYVLRGINTTNTYIEGFSLISSNTLWDNCYSIILSNSHQIFITHNIITSENGDPGRSGADAPPASHSNDGNDGDDGALDTDVVALGGLGGGDPSNCTSARGGRGGAGRYAENGLDGESVAARGGVGGTVGNPGTKGENAWNGHDGTDGSDGESGPKAQLSTFGLIPIRANDGEDGSCGDGGGGGGAGGGQTGLTVTDGTGNAGGGGGSGGGGGHGGNGGNGGGSSIAIYLFNSTDISIISNVITTHDGGNGGNGSNGSIGATGGNGGLGATVGNGNEIGKGGNGGYGGNGGNGGHGGGGHGGSSIGILKDINTTLIETTNTYLLGNSGTGGLSEGNNGSDGFVADVLTW